MSISDNELALVGKSGLSPSVIRQALAACSSAVPEIFVSYETESTNKDAKEYYEKQGDCTAVFIADGQTGGRGRRGRSFASAHGSGIYMSLLICPRGELCSLTSVTTFTAVAVCRAIERVSGLSPDVKWVNDIYYKGKKLGGILTEGALSEDMRMAKYVIIGIGLNVLETDFPEEIRSIATSLESATGKKYDRNLLATEIIKELIGSNGRFSSREIVEEYRRRSFIVGRDITVHRLSCSYDARVLSIEDDMSLRIRLADGREEKLVTGEVSVKVL